MANRKLDRFATLERDATARLDATRAREYGVLWLFGLVALGLAVAESSWGLYIIGVILSTASAWHNGRLS